MVIAAEKRVIEVSPKTLECACAIGSYVFARVAKEFGYKVDLVVGRAFAKKGNDINHCWNTYEDIIIDLTAKQFDGCLPLVYIVEKDNNNYSLPRKPNFEDWPNEQNPYNNGTRFKILPYIKKAINSAKSLI